MSLTRIVAALVFVLAGTGQTFLVRPLVAATPQAPSAESLAARVQQRYDSVRDFTADFTLAQSGGLTLRSAVDRGKVSIRKPGHMRWVIETGNTSETVSDGVQIYNYFPKDKYVTISPVPTGDHASSGLLLLSGRGSMTRDFVPSLPASQPAAEWRLVLTPKVKQHEFTALAVVVDRTSLQLRGLDITDPQGTTQTFRFSNLRENQGLKDSVFEFRIPKGVIIK